MLRCLIAEDEWYISQLLEELVKEAFNAEVVLTESGNKAIQILNHDRNFDFIISDFQMADGNGEDLLNFLIQNNIKIPFAFYTSLTDKRTGPAEFFLGYFQKADFEGLANSILGCLKLR